MTGDAERCYNPECGCRTTVYPTREKCPNCGGQLRLSGRSQLLEFRLACPNCGYHSPLLSPEELQVLL